MQADYEWIELAPYGYLPTDLKILRPELERRNLKAVACDVMLQLEDPALWPVIKEEALKVGAMVAGVDGKYVMLLDDVYIDLHTGKPTGPSRLDEDGWKRSVDTTQSLGNLDGWAIVEQDMYPTPFDKPLPIAKRTRAYLREIGIW